MSSPISEKSQLVAFLTNNLDSRVEQVLGKEDTDRLINKIANEYILLSKDIDAAIDMSIGIYDFALEAPEGGESIVAILKRTLGQYQKEISSRESDERRKEVSSAQESYGKESSSSTTTTTTNLSETERKSSDEREEKIARSNQEGLYNFLNDEYTHWIKKSGPIMTEVNMSRANDVLRIVSKTYFEENEDISETRRSVNAKLELILPMDSAFALDLQNFISSALEKFKLKNKE